MTFILIVFYILAGVLLTHKHEWFPFKEKGRWNWRSWILFLFGVLFWFPIGVILFICLLKNEKVF